MLDVDGAIMDAHDGTIQQFEPEGPYYMHAVSYGLCQVCAVRPLLCLANEWWTRGNDDDDDDRGSDRDDGSDADGGVMALPPTPTRLPPAAPIPTQIH
jgi:hypothetical protein